MRAKLSCKRMVVSIDLGASIMLAAAIFALYMQAKAHNLRTPDAPSMQRMSVENDFKMPKAYNIFPTSVWFICVSGLETSCSWFLLSSMFLRAAVASLLPCQLTTGCFGKSVST